MFPFLFQRYGELYLSSVKPDGRTRSSSVGDFDTIARDILWYKGDFEFGKPHGTGLVKYKEPLAAAAMSCRNRLRVSSRPRTLSSPVLVPGDGRGGGAVSRSGRGAEARSLPNVPAWGESKEDGEEEIGRGNDGVGVGVERVEGALELTGTDEDDEDDEEEEGGGRLGGGHEEHAGGDLSDSEEEEEEEEEETRRRNTSPGGGSEAEEKSTVR